VNGNNGALTQGATFAPGKVGLAFSLNGSGATIEIPDSPALNPSNVTIEAWVNFAAMDTRFALAPGAQYIVFKRNSRYDRFEGYALLKIKDDNGVDRLCFGVTSAEGNQVGTLSSSAVVIGKWYHVAGTYDGAVARLFVNGIMEDSHRAGFPLNYGTRPLFIGSSGETFWPGNLNGLVDEVSLYNRALSPAEIAGIYEAGSGGKPKPAGWNAWSITDFVMCENAKMVAPHDWHVPKDVFQTGDSKVFAWAELTNVSGVHSVEMKLWRPDGIYYGKETQVTHEPLASSNWWRMSAWWGIKGDKMAETPGRWKLDLVIDGTLQRSIYFTLNSENPNLALPGQPAGNEAGVCILEASSDLVNWTPIRTNALPGGLAWETMTVKRAFRLTLRNQDSPVCILETSPDLVNWTPIQTNALPRVLPSDTPGAPRTAAQFYRALVH